MKPSRPVFVLSLGAASILLAMTAATVLLIPMIVYTVLPLREAGIETVKPYIGLLISVVSTTAGFIAWILGAETVNDMKEDARARADAALAKVGYGIGVVGTVIASTMTLIYLLAVIA